MSPEELLRQFEALAERVQIEVRYSALDGEGGLCRVRNRRVIVLNSRLSIDEKVDVLARSLPREELEQMFIPPALRERIQQASRNDG